MLQSLLVIFALLLLWNMLRQRRADMQPVMGEAANIESEDLYDHVEHPYHCVACKCANGNCKAVDPLRGRVFLVGENLELPRPECTSMPCRCRYVHYADRRQSKTDRRAVFGLESDMYRFTHDRDRRVSLGRRIEDWSIEDDVVELGKTLQ